jgi:hypothetical protein
MVEIKEVLRLWRAGIKKKRIASQLTLDVKTVRRYITAAEACGLVPGPEPPLDDEQVAAVVAALAADTGRPHGDAWLRCEAERDAIEKLVTDGSGSRRSGDCCTGAASMCRTRRCIGSRSPKLGFGQRGPTIPVADGKPARRSTSTRAG